MTREQSDTATPQEIREWHEEHDEPHPVFEVEFRPERLPVEFVEDDTATERDTE